MLFLNQEGDSGEDPLASANPPPAVDSQRNARKEHAMKVTEQRCVNTIRLVLCWVGLFLCLWLLVSMASAQANPVPFSQSLNPVSVLPGGPGFTLTVNGANFISGSTVNWNGSPLATTFISAGRLTAVVPTADTATQGAASITVASPGAGSSLPLFLSVASPISSSSVVLNKTDFALGLTPSMLVTGDFNGDGNLDVATVYPGNISVLLGNGDGTFRVPIVSAGQPFPSEYAVSGDFNGDGKLDFAGLDLSNGYLYVQLGNGDGTFQPFVETPALGGFFFTTGDFNRDGKLDLAVTGPSDLVTVYFGNGDGTFVGASQTVTDRGPFDIATGDFNNDGMLDIAAVVQTSGSVDILVGNGDGTFVKTEINYSNNNPQKLTVGDLNNDGNLDLAVTGNFPYVAILLGQGNGTFVNAGVTHGFGVGLAVGDFNSDGALDLASGLGGGFNGEFSLFIANSPGQFGFNPINVLTEAPWNDVVLGDFNGDGRLDVAFPGSLGASIFSESDLDLSPPILAFPTVLVGRSSRPQVATLSNVGLVPVTVTSISSSAEFPETNACGSTLLGGASCAISVGFVPTASGARSGSLVVASSAGSPLTVSLAGTGVLTWVNLDPSLLSFGDVAVGTSSQPQAVTLTNTSTRPLKITKIGIAGPALGDFSETNNCGSGIARGASCTINVTFTPTALGGRVADLLVSDNGGDSPQQVRLTGTGT